MHGINDSVLHGINDSIMHGKNDSIVYHINNSNVDLVKPPVWLTVAMVSVSIWVIIANCLVFMCLVTCRNMLKNSVNVQLLSLSLTDMLVGIMTIPSVFPLTPVRDLFSKYESCAFIIYTYFVAQSATLYHTLIICINRLVAIRRISTVNGITNNTFKTIFIQIVAVWTGCFVFYIIHFLAFARFGETVRCTSDHLFEDNHLVAFGLLTIPLLVPGHLCINIIYVYLIIHIRQRLGVVGIVQEAPKHSPNIVRLKSFHIHEKPSSSLKPCKHTSHRSEKQSRFEVKKGLDREGGYAQTKVQSLNEQEVVASTSYKSKCNRNRAPDSDSQEIAPTTMANKETVTDFGRTQTNNNRLGLERQRRVLVTFGILLTALNLFMTPLDFMTIIEIIRNRPLSRSVRIVFVTMAMLNSALNPVINIWRMKPFRELMKQKARKVYESLRFWRN